MPIYLYYCNSCGLSREELLSIEERDAEQLCANCKSKMQRLINTTAVIYKCGGFYCTDYGK